jgi:hypothetical protein
MALTIPNPTYATQGPTKSGQLFNASELSQLQKAFIGRTTITLDNQTQTGTINFVDGTEAIFATGTSRAYPNQGLSNTVAPKAVIAYIVGAGGNSGTNVVANLESLTITTGTPTTTGFPFYLSGVGVAANDTLTIQFEVYRS